MDNIFIGEFLGTATLILLGNGVVANSIFKKTIGSKGGWIVITLGWAIAVFTGVSVANIWDTGGHINPAVTMGLLFGDQLKIVDGLVYMASQFLGAFVGQIIVVIFYWQHIKEEEQGTVLSAHSTGPTHKSIFTNSFSEFIGTVVLVTMAYFAISSDWFQGAPFAIALTVLVIGLSLGGTTGYAINPARDLSPRVVHALIYRFTSLKSKVETVNSNWTYSWIPVVAPTTAGIVVGLFHYAQ